MSIPPQADIPQQLTAANTAWTKLRRLAAYASFDGWSLVVLGACSLICGGYGSVMGLLVSFALLGTGGFELSRVRRLRRLNPVAIKQLAFNQLVLAAAIILYSAFSLIHARGGGSISPEVEQALTEAGVSAGDADTKNLVSFALQILYIGLITLALLVQGGTAMFYFSRQKHLERYIQQTPDWIQQMQRERGEVSI